MISLSTLLKHYKRRDIQEEIVLAAEGKEIGVQYGLGKFGKRPDILQQPAEILELAKNGATSFHASEEIWINPLMLNVEMKKKEIEELRKGWDLVIDIDCPYFQYSKIAAYLIIKALKHHNIKSISCKFSGNKGFHIGVPFEAFPDSIAGIETSKRFPDAVRDVAFYIKDMVEGLFLKKVGEMENGDVEKIAANLKKNKEDILMGSAVKKLDMSKILDIDTLLISSRHLYRMPYSLHEKSSLCSIPVDPEKVLEFKKEMAIPSKVVVDTKLRFLDREKSSAGEAKELFDRAISGAMSKKRSDEYKVEEKKEYEIPATAVPEKFFPPCMHIIFNGLEDGRKRAVFTLINFLASNGWEYDQIEVFLKDWNKKNKPPLRENEVVTQVRYAKAKRKKVLPPNCMNMNYYKGMGVCKPDNLCQKIKNPVSYSSRKMFAASQNSKKK